MREACPGARGQVATHTGFPGASRCLEPSPEAEDGDDDDHQHQHHTHDRSACNQGQLLPPALILWGRKHTIRRIRPPPGALHQPRGRAVVPENSVAGGGRQRRARLGKHRGFQTAFYRSCAPLGPLRASEEVSQPYYCHSGFDLAKFLPILVSTLCPQHTSLPIFSRLALSHLPKCHRF